MKQVRYGIFETNSSSTHSLVICTAEEYNKFKNGELVLDRWGSGEIVGKDKVKNRFDYQTYEDYYNDDLEPFWKRFTTPSGDKMIAFGKYGYDG